MQEQLFPMFVSTEQTITLKEITDKLKVRHNNAIRTLEIMQGTPEFGLATPTEYPIITGKGKQEIIQTYSLTKRQSIAIAARLNLGLLMVIVDYWIARENGAYASQSPSEEIDNLLRQIELLTKERDEAKDSAIAAIARAASFERHML